MTRNWRKNIFWKSRRTLWVFRKSFANARFETWFPLSFLHAHAPGKVFGNCSLLLSDIFRIQITTARQSFPELYSELRMTQASEKALSCGCSAERSGREIRYRFFENSHWKGKRRIRKRSHAFAGFRAVMQQTLKKFAAEKSR